MTTKEFLKHLATLDQEMVEDLTEMRDKEMEKPVDQWDIDMIVEITKAIIEICGYPEPTEEDKKPMHI